MLAAPSMRNGIDAALGSKELDARELRSLLGLSDAKSFRQRYLARQSTPA